MEARHHVALAAHPLGIVGSGAVERRIKQRLPETPHVNDQGEAALYGHGANARAEIPCNLRIQSRQAQFALLSLQSSPSPRSVPCTFFSCLLLHHREMNNRALVDARAGGGRLRQHAIPAWPADEAALCRCPSRPPAHPQSWAARCECQPSPEPRWRSRSAIRKSPASRSHPAFHRPVRPPAGSRSVARCPARARADPAPAPFPQRQLCTEGAQSRPPRGPRGATPATPRAHPRPPCRERRPSAAPGSPPRAHATRGAPPCPQPGDCDRMWPAATSPE